MAKRTKTKLFWKKVKISCILSIILVFNLQAQHWDKPRPEAWDNLVFGARFMDRILPAPIYEGLEYDTWGTDKVVPRDIHNGIEDPEWSYWGGKPVVGPDGKYHFYVARWREDDPRGHRAWPTSTIVHAVSDRPTGPFIYKDEVGPGHFPEITPLLDGRYAIYHFHGYYISDSLDGPWENVVEECGFHKKTTFGSLVLREDGSMLMLDRVMKVWLKDKDSDEFRLVNENNIEPVIPGSYEDPLIWKTEVQYHLLVNDWYGRTAYHLRSRDGIIWKEDPGEAYSIDFDAYEDGTKVGWYKYERPKVLQDEYGRATHLYLAVIDVPKKEDLGNDNHSSKNIALPLVVGRRLQILNKNKITQYTREIKVRVLAEKGFDPHKDINIKSLKFGAPEEVDFGRGCSVIGTEKDGKDIILTFDGKGNGITASNFAAKLIGKTSDDKLLFGYASLPWLDNEQALKESNVGGYLITQLEKVDESFNAGYSMYSAAWPLVKEYPGREFQSGLFGTWMHPSNDGPLPVERLYTDIEGGLGWWRDTEYATETPKFIMGGVQLNFAGWANGPGAGKGRDWDNPRGKYGVAQLSPWILWPPDGLNLKQGTSGELFGSGYLPLPLTEPKSVTDGKNVSTGNQCWTLFLNTGNFKGPVAFFTPYFWTQASVEDPKLDGLFLDQRPSKANKPFQMETQYIHSAEATDSTGQKYARVAPTQYPVDHDGNTNLLHRLMVYNKKALWDDVEDWFNGGEPSDGKIDVDEAVMQKFKTGVRSSWSFFGKHIPKDKRARLNITSFLDANVTDTSTLRVRWEGDLIKKQKTENRELVTLPEYYKFEKSDNDDPGEWVAVAPGEVPEETGLHEVDFRNESKRNPMAYTTPDDPESSWKYPGPAAGPFKTKLGDGSTVTYYWYRFADQPALLNADMSEEEREEMQRRVELLHRKWTKDREYLPPPMVGELAEIDPALIVTPPKGLEVGYVPIVTSQGIEPDTIVRPVKISPVIEGKPPSDAIILFDRDTLSKFVSVETGGAPEWEVAGDEFTVKPGTNNIMTKQKFRDCQLHIEWKTSYWDVIEGKTGQKCSNSGIYLMSKYEIQVLNSFNNDTYPEGQSAAFYGNSAPLVNASLRPGKWQVYDIVFIAPEFDENEELLEPGYITLFHNGVLVLNHVEVTAPTASNYEDFKLSERALPLMLQDHNNKVSYRNIWIRKLDE